MQNQQGSFIPQGWLRAIILLALYIGISIAAGMVISSMQAWFAFSFLLSIFLVYVFRRYIDNKSFISLGLNYSRLLPDLAIGVSLAVFVISTGTVIIYFLEGIEWTDIVNRSGDLLMSAIVLMMVAIGEELVFRGYVLRNLMKSLNKWLALVASACLFTAVHATNPDVLAISLINTFLGGMVTGITFIYSRNLWLPIAFHFTWNFVQGPVYGFKVSGLQFNSILLLETSGEDAISGGSYGFEGSVVCTVLLCIALIPWCYMESRKVAITPTT